MQSSTGISG